ncbi:hypothetical protein [Mycoplasma simbae]|uniref:hypothetical protein n=1 Tax=Mycoplasma simbae TaxID=36744 RepID=UPI0004958706|nr:hypothetical protein [Mycoplasma simbae]
MKTKKILMTLSPLALALPAAAVSCNKEKNLSKDHQYLISLRASADTIEKRLKNNKFKNEEQNVSLASQLSEKIAKADELLKQENLTDEQIKTLLDTFVPLAKTASDLLNFQEDLAKLELVKTQLETKISAKETPEDKKQKYQEFVQKITSAIESKNKEQVSELLKQSYLL